MEWFGDIIIRAVLQPPHPILRVGSPGDKDYRDITLLTQFAGKVKPIIGAKSKIKRHDINAMGLDASQRVVLISGFNNIETICLQPFAKRQAKVLFIINDQNGFVMASNTIQGKKFQLIAACVKIDSDENNNGF
jgi:hypothetical protein